MLGSKVMKMLAVAVGITASTSDISDYVDEANASPHPANEMEYSIEYDGIEFSKSIREMVDTLSPIDAGLYTKINPGLTLGYLSSVNNIEFSKFSKSKLDSQTLNRMSRLYFQYATAHFHLEHDFNAYANYSRAFQLSTNVDPFVLDIVRTSGELRDKYSRKEFVEKGANILANLYYDNLIKKDQLDFAVKLYDNIYNFKPNIQPKK